ncbi:AAA family ATPase [Candidatus Roizmanbacteria bacterium CG22_combo_CG10-13_8_21_14_all_35_9]|uniref:AAA family ATPase n=2 Tax=Candidatus Roizmaniibacteriota TaxID=1752723 RepID=A0A2M8F3X9_9BACT|nr:MAG: AAA family ATPase [Candidatus Roizmanbacteria bacterium CG22_combo_CG10-13_8_21_14_all_35_9]PJC33987.1 MAG: AAA family ATPase [Candidatus Roizmanbacteria bacterium CG_4_9_14_0_2_um_filter_35_15]
MKNRYISDNIINDLKEKMVFVAGPRQVGKTTLAKYLGQNAFSSFSYLSWDYQPDRKKIIRFQLPTETELLIFDELHKYKKWRNYIKGIFDKHKNDYSILLTGSARLDIYRKSSDSLVGRYHQYILHPFSLAEFLGIKTKNQPFNKLNFSKNDQGQSVLQKLIKYGPFPEPLLKHDETHWRRWQIEKNDRLVKEEIRSLTTIEDLSAVQILVELLPDRVGSLLSVNNLREDMEIAHKTLVNYLRILELFYFHFQIYPYARKTIRSLKKMSKLYLWDWSVIEKEGVKFENLIAAHLLKYAHFLKDSLGHKTKLYYLRDKEGREVDFLFTVDDRPWFAVEVKLEEEKSYLGYYQKKLKIPFVYQAVKKTGIDCLKEDVRIISADKFLTAFV